MNSSPLLDITTIEPQTIIPEWPICSGYLDNVLYIFEKHNHPFVLVSTLAMNWSGANNMPEKEIDVLVRSSQLNCIVNDLIASGEWKSSSNRARKGYYDSMINNTSIKDIWLKSCIDDPQFEYFRFWPEALYKLSVDCNKLEIPDVWAPDRVLLEEEYYRDPYGRFGPPRLSTAEGPLLPRLQVRAKFTRRDLPIFIPTIEEHLNAYLDQRRAEIDTGLLNGGAPEWQIRNFIRYLFLDWAPTRDWLLSSKIRERNRPLMNERLDNWRRKPLILYDNVLKRSVFDKMPWELTIDPEKIQPQPQPASSPSTTRALTAGAPQSEVTLSAKNSRSDLKRKLLSTSFEPLSFENRKFKIDDPETPVENITPSGA